MAGMLAEREVVSMFSGCMAVAWVFLVAWVCAVLFGLVRFIKYDEFDRWFFSVFNPFVASLILAMFFVGHG